MKDKSEVDMVISMSSIDPVINRLKEKKIIVEKVLSRLELMRRLAEFNQTKFNK